MLGSSLHAIAVACGVALGGCTPEGSGTSDSSGPIHTGVPASTGTSTTGDDTADGPSSVDTASSGHESATTTGEGVTTSGPVGSDTTGAPPTNLLANPSLETWTSAAEPNVTPDEWVQCSVDGGLGVEAVPDSCTALPEMASDGLRYARAYGGEGLGQTIDTVAGQTYVVAFDYTAVDDCFGGGSDSQWEVRVDGQVILTTPQDPNPSWTAAEVSFVAEASSTELCFRRIEGSTQGGIDALSVLPQ